MGESTLVSIVMPAYKFQYFEAALDSVLNQSYSDLELVICDDSPDQRIEQLIERKRQGVSFPIRYYRNEQRLGELGGTAKAIRLAEGRYIKFLHDDDVLEPECIEELVAVMERDPGVALASSRRRRIDEEGEPLPDILATCFPFAGDVLIDGRELVSFLGEHTINFIGEPSCVLCRREDLLEVADQLMSLNGKLIHWVGDLALYAKLLQRGNLAFLSKPLTKFRVSTQQFSQQGRDQPGIGEKGHADFRQAIRDLGWFRAGEDNRFVRLAPITRLKTRVFKPVNLLAAIRRAAELGSVSLSSWLSARLPSEVQQTLIDQRLQAQGGGPRIAVMLLDRVGDPAAVERTLASLQNVNLYRNLDVRVFSPAVEDGALVCRLNLAIADLDSDWLVLVEAGVEFTSSGLLIAALDLIGAPDSCQAVYADEVMRLEVGELGLSLRPDLNLDLLLSFPAAMSRHWLYRRAGFLELGGFAEEFDQAFELEYQLRLIERQGLGCAGHISEPLLVSCAFDLRDDAQERAVIERHLWARGYQQAQVTSQFSGRYELNYRHQLQPLVSIVVLVKDRLAQVQRCMDTLLDNTSYPHYEVLLLEHGGVLPEVREWLSAVEQMGVEQIRVLRFSANDSQASLRNQAAMEARGDVLLWLDAGAGIMDRDWLQQLLNHALRPEVGAVAGKLLAADGNIRHAGLLLGLCGPAGRAFEGASCDEAGYMHRLQVEQNYSALSGECLMLRRDIFLEVGGFEEAAQLSRWTDVDLCLKLQQAGYLNVWTPRVQVLIDAHLLPAATREEEDAVYARWLPKLARDPAYNSNLSLVESGGFKLADNQLSWRPLAAWRPLPTVLAHPADLTGCGQYRVIQPFNALQQQGFIDGGLSFGMLSVVDLQRYDPDVVLLQRQIGDERLEAMRRMQAFSRAFKVYELDDYLPNLPMKSAYRANMPKDILRSLRRGISYADRFVVSTQAMAEAFKDFHQDIRVVKNRLDPRQWSGLSSQRRSTSKPRVGWAGGVGHTGDLEMLTDVIKALASEVEWVFFGMCPDKLRPYIHEFHPGVAIEQYPVALAGLNLDLALAPVEQNLFNECKSNLRLLEYGACGFPVICSDVRCYQDGLPVTRVKNRFKDWLEAIRMHLADLDAAARMGDELRAAVNREWMLEGQGLEAWRKAWLPD